MCERVGFSGRFLMLIVFSDYSSGVLLDANENAFGPSLPSQGKAFQSNEANRHTAPTEGDFLSSLNRYPDPYHPEIKQLICNLRNSQATFPLTRQLKPENLFLGVGSDEAIDSVFRIFCKPAHDKVLITSPTYGMYKVSAAINDIGVVDVPLAEPTFQPNINAIQQKLRDDPSIKMVFFCSPGNPTGSLIKADLVRDFLRHTRSFWNGILIIDEAYIDFASAGSSLCHDIHLYPNLIVLQTLSKAFGLAGIRMGVAFSNTDIIQLFNNLKAPYNISSPTAYLANQGLGPAGLEIMATHLTSILAQRDRLVREFARLRKLGKVGQVIGGLDANFIMIQILDKSGQVSNDAARALYTRLAEGEGVVVRFRGSETGCFGCLRVTVGTESEVDLVLAKFEQLLPY